MERNIYELSELLEVLRICQPEEGFPSGSLTRLILLYFTKYYKTELEFTEIAGRQLIASDKCMIYIDAIYNISAKQIVEELTLRKLIERTPFIQSDQQRFWKLIN